MPEIVSRAEAREQGLINFFTGKPCINGHVSERVVKKGECIDCMKIRSKKRSKKKSQKRKELEKKEYEEKKRLNPDIISREEALEQELEFYFTGVPCKRGHISKRLVSRLTCCDCNKEINEEKKLERKKSSPLKKELKKKEYEEKKRLNPDIISREEALEQELEFYFTGEPCILGHIDKRDVKNSDCLSCRQEKGKNKTKNKTEEDRVQDRIINKIFRDKNKVKIKKYRAEWLLENKDEQLAKKASNRIKRLTENPFEKIIESLRSRLYSAMKTGGYRKTKTTMNLIGCDTNQIKLHLEKQFEINMNFENYGEWHIDHIVPINYFVKNYDFLTEEIQKIAFHYSNLQPMWAAHNISKSDRISKSNAEKKIAEIRKQIGADKRSDV